MAIVRQKTGTCFHFKWDYHRTQETNSFSVIGASNYKLLSSLIAPDKPGDKECSQLVEKLSEHFAPAPSEIVKRFKFHTSFQKPEESVNQPHCLSETTFREHWPQSSFSSSEVRLSSYSGESIPVLSSVDVKVTYKCQSLILLCH